MATASPVPRLTDIIEAVELIRSEMAGVTHLESDGVGDVMALCGR
jgi:hypothetical protein